MQSEGPVTSILYRGFLSFSRVLQQMLSWCTHYAFHHVLRVQPNMLISKFGPNTARTPNLPLSLSLSLLLHSQNSPIPITLTPSLPIPYLVSNVPLAGRVGTVGTCRATKCCHFPCHTSTEQHKHLCTDRTVLLAAFYDIAETRHLRQLCELT